MKKIFCPICNSNKIETRCELNEDNIDNFLEFSKIKYNSFLEEIVNQGLHPKIYGCNDCMYCWYNEIPTDKQLMEMYMKANSLGLNPHSKSKQLKKKSNTLLINGILRILNKKNKINLLDYGSGKGEFSKLASNYSINVTAFEPSISRNSLKLTKNINYVNDLGVLKNKIKFDLIVLDNVLEHLPNPESKLLELKKYCSKDTLIYINVPNLLRAHEGKNIWKNWPYRKKSMVHTMAPFEHLSGFTPKSLEILLYKCKFFEVSNLVNLIFSPNLFFKKIILNLFNLGGSTIKIVKIK